MGINTRSCCTTISIPKKSAGIRSIANRIFSVRPTDTYMPTEKSSFSKKIRQRFGLHPAPGDKLLSAFPLDTKRIYPRPDNTGRRRNSAGFCKQKIAPKKRQREKYFVQIDVFITAKSERGMHRSNSEGSDRSHMQRSEIPEQSMRRVTDQRNFR